MPLNFNSVAEQAKRHVLKGRHDKAIDLWTDFLPQATDADAANVHNQLGDVYSRKKDTVSAIDEYLAASQEFERCGFPLKAIAALKKIIKIDPDRSEVHMRLGDLNARRDMIGNAVEAYLTVVRLMARADEPESALALLKKVCILDPVNIRHRLQLASESIELGFIEQGMEETINAVDLYLEKGNLEEAERYCRHLLDMDANYASARERLDRIAAWGREGHDAASMGGENAIDDLFAELDGMIDDIEGGPIEAEPTPTGSENAPAFSFDDLLEPNQVDSDKTTDDTTDSAQAPDLLLGLDGDAFGQLAAMESDQGNADPRQAAFEHLDAGNLEQALDAFDQFVTESIANNQHGKADAALKAYLALDSDNPLAHEIRLRIYEGRDQEMETEILEQLVELWSDRDPQMADQFASRLAQASGINLQTDHIIQPKVASPDDHLSSDSIELDAPFVSADTDNTSDDASDSGAEPQRDWLTLNGENIEAHPEEQKPVSLDAGTDDTQDDQATSPALTLEDIDPFAQGADVEDTPSLSLDDADPFAINAAAEGSTALSQESADPFNLSEEIDPFNLGNDADDTEEAPAISLDDADPFAVTEEAEDNDLFRISLDVQPDTDETEADLGEQTINISLNQPADEPSETVQEDTPWAASMDASENLFAIHQEVDDEAVTTAAETPSTEAPEAAMSTSLASETTDEAACSDNLSAEMAEDHTDTTAVETHAAPVATPSTTALDVEEALAEAAFYAYENLTGEAVALYRTILEHDPDNETARIELKALSPEALDSVATAPTQPTQNAPKSKPVSNADTAALATTIQVPLPPSGTAAVMHVRDDDHVPDDEEFLDFASDIQDAIEEDINANGQTLSEDPQLDEILSAFRDGIREQVDDEDSETHYDLGTAFREMGLLEEAVGEFQLAVKGAMRYADACIALSECFAGLGRDHLAVSQLREALEKTDCTPDQWVALTYELATVLEKTGESQEAKQRYEEVYAHDIAFRDVAQKVASLH